MAKSVVYDFSGQGDLLKMLGDVEKSSKKLRKQMKGLAKDSIKAGAGLERMGKGAVALGGRLRNMSLVAGAAVVASAKSFGDFESGLIDIINLLEDDAAVKKYSATLEGLSKGAIREFGFSTAEANKGLFDTVSAMGANERAFLTFTESQRLAIGGAADLRVAVDGMTTIMEVYAVDLEDVTEVSNAFFASQVAGKTTVEELAANIGNVASGAREAGFGFKPVLAAMSELTKRGLRTTVATTALNAAIFAMKKPSKEAEVLLKQLGIPFNTTQLKAKGLVETFRQIAIVSKKNPDVLAKMFPQESLRALEVLNLDAIQNMEKTLESMNKNLLDEAVIKKQETFNEVIRQAWGGVRLMAIEVGKALSPAIKALAFGITLLTTAFSKLDPFLKSSLAWALVMAGGISVVLTLFGKTALILPTLATAFGPLILAAKFLFALLTVGFSLLVGVIGFIPAVIAVVVAGLIAAGVIIFKNIDKILAAKDAVLAFLGLGGGDVKIGVEVGPKGLESALPDKEATAGFLSNLFSGSDTLKVEAGIDFESIDKILAAKKATIGLISGDEDLKIEGVANITNDSTLRADINITTPKGTTAELQTSSTGPGFETGVQMETVL